MTGQIIRIISNLYTVKINTNIYECHARGKFRNNNETPLVGDICEIDIENNYILKILPRKNELKRPMISNVDIALIITSVKEPDLSLYLLDKLMINVLVNNIEPVICFTKIDLISRRELKEIKQIKRYYELIGVKVFFNSEIKKIKKYLKNKIIVLTGQTGAGKSSLLNKLDKSLNLNTTPISKSLGRGVHTTRHIELFDLDNILIADTPGFSSSDLDNITKEDLKKLFVEFKKYDCDYKDCNHVNENKCGIKDAVKNKEILQTRYENYLSFFKEVSK